MTAPYPSSIFFFFNDTATTEIYTLSLHDALPIFLQEIQVRKMFSFLGLSAQDFLAILKANGIAVNPTLDNPTSPGKDRKSTRLNSSHLVISYAVFCLKKKK